jgi:hypothetical protein
MIKYCHDHTGKIIAEIEKGTATISTPGDMLDIKYPKLRAEFYNF